MMKDPKLIDELQAATKEMTPAELMKFRRELKRRIPGVVHYAADRARKKKENEEKDGE